MTYDENSVGFDAFGDRNYSTAAAFTARSYRLRKLSIDDSTGKGRQVWDVIHQPRDDEETGPTPDRYRLVLSQLACGPHRLIVYRGKTIKYILPLRHYLWEGFQQLRAEPEKTVAEERKAIEEMRRLVGISFSFNVTTWQAIRATLAESAASKAVEDLREANEETTVALQEKSRAEREASARLARANYERGLTFCNDGEIDRGMAYLARALSALPDGESELETAIRMNLSAWASHLHRPIATFALHGHARRVSSIQFSPDASVVLVYFDDIAERRRFLQVLEAPLLKPIGDPIELPAWSDRDQVDIEVWDVLTQQRIGEIVHEGASIGTTTFGPKGDKLVTAGRDGMAQL